MITIQMAGGMLDVKSDQDMSFEWTAFRFAEGLRDQYTNDLELPKTHNNISILGCYNLLDSPNQLYGNHIQPAILTVDGRMTECYIQIVSVNKTTITVCLYEKTFPMELRDKNIARMFEDDYTTIIAWNTNTMDAYPDWFKKYDYGMPYDKNYAQYHPIKRLDDILPDVSANLGFGLPSINPDWYVMATKKVVCPQNTKQYIEGKMKSDHTFAIMGGQHITNDLEYSAAITSNDRITFDRDCSVAMDIWIGWKSRTNSYNVPFVVTHWKEETQTSNTYEFQLDGLNYTNGVTTGNASFNVKRGDSLIFGVISGSYYDMVSMVAHLEITDYEITLDDYDREMTYVARLPRLQVYQYAANSYEYWYFDSNTYNLGYHYKGSSSTSHKNVQTPYASFAWFGYWANVPDISAAELLWGIAWLLGKKPVFANGEFNYEDADVTAVIDGNVTETRPASTYFGMKNYIRFSNEENPEPISEIDNVWLENEKDLHKSPFGLVKNLSQYSGIVQQYSNPEYDSESGEYSCDFEDAGFVIVENISHINNIQVISPFVKDIQIKRFGLGMITSVTEVDIETFNSPLQLADYIYLDGRKFMVISGETDIKTRKSTITAVLVPTI